MLAVAGLFAGGLAIGSAQAALGPNLIQNGDFESGTGNYPGVGKYWETNDSQSHPDVDVLTTTTRHAGQYAQWLKANSAWDLGAVRQVGVYNSVVAGKTYRAQAWIKTANVANPNGWYVFGIWWFHNDTYLSDSKMPRPETNNYDWRLISWDVVAPAGANRVAAFLTRHTDGDAWYDDVFVGEATTDPPAIGYEPVSFSHRIRKGAPIDDDSFTVQNVGGGTLSYTIAASATWLSVSPTNGTSTGEVNTCLIHYNAGSLASGDYTATVTIADPNATNSPRTIGISLSVVLPGDADGDGDVDQEDFGCFQLCYSEPGVPQTYPACVFAMMDNDNDVDLDDWALWEQCYSGPGAPAKPPCNNGSP